MFEREFMTAARNALFVLLFPPLISFAHSTNAPPIEDENGLLTELTAVKSSEESRALLKLYRQFITGKLCDKLIEEADKLYYSTDYPKSLLIYGIAKQSAEELNDNLRLIKALNSLSFASMKAGDYKKAREYSEQSLATAEAAKNKSWMASALLTIGTVNLWEGNHKEALDHLQNCLTLYRELNERDFTADALITIGQVYSATGLQLPILVWKSASSAKKIAVIATSQQMKRANCLLLALMSGRIFARLSSWQSIQECVVGRYSL